MPARILIALCAVALQLAAQDPQGDPQLLRWMNGIAQQQLDRRAAEIARVRSVEAAEQRKETVRKTLLELMGGLPVYAGPLNAKITGQIERPKYVIEKVVFESLPRYWVTADIYRPKTPGRYPAVLIPLGHWDEGKVAEQRTAANLAMKGFVALAYDPVGQGERLQAYDERLGKSLGAWATEQHIQAGAQSLLVGQSLARYMIHDGRRALDYLVSRPDVDADRIGCTGCSGGGTLTTYISALDPRIKVAAPACWMNSYRTLFTGPVGDSEQSLPSFLSSGLDETDYVELFAPKPWMIVSTVEDFFPIEGARQVYDEARRWYALYGKEDHVAWAVGPGQHGTPQPVRERIYEWMIRWLKDGKGDSREEPLEMAPNHELLATTSGQVSIDLASRDLYQIIRERLPKTGNTGSTELLDEIRRVMRPAREAPLAVRTVEEIPGENVITRKILIESEPGMELHGTLLVPRTQGRKPGLVVIETGAAASPFAGVAAGLGVVVLAITPRGLPAPAARQFGGDWLMNTRAMLIGRNLAGLRAYDIRRGVELLASREDVDAGSIRAAAHGEAGIWLLMAAASDSRIKKVWLDRTPYSLRIALDRPVNRNLYSAVIPGFCLKWDLADLARTIEGRSVIWTDPTDWLGIVRPIPGRYRYRAFDEGDGPLLEELLR